MRLVASGFHFFGFGNRFLPGRVSLVRVVMSDDDVSAQFADFDQFHALAATCCIVSGMFGEEMVGDFQSGRNGFFAKWTLGWSVQIDHLSMGFDTLFHLNGSCVRNQAHFALVDGTALPLGFDDTLVRSDRSFADLGNTDSTGGAICRILRAFCRIFLF